MPEKLNPNTNIFNHYLNLRNNQLNPATIETYGRSCLKSFYETPQKSWYLPCRETIPTESVAPFAFYAFFPRCGSAEGFDKIFIPPKQSGFQPIHHTLPSILTEILDQELSLRYINDLEKPPDDFTKAQEIEREYFHTSIPTILMALVQPREFAGSDSLGVVTMSHGISAETALSIVQYHARIEYQELELSQGRFN